MMRALITSVLLTLMALPGVAAESAIAQNRTSSAQILTVQNSIGPGMGTVAAGLRVTLEPGWKTYWRSPGEVGLPPELDWSQSQNVSDVTLDFPAPTRFTAFEIENFGYAKEVVFPLSITLAEPGAPARLDLSLNILVCEAVCIPEVFDLTLDLPAGDASVDPTAATLIATWNRKVPLSGAQAGVDVAGAGLAGDQLIVALRGASPFTAPDIFPEHGDYAAFGKPDVRLSQDRLTLWAALPVLAAGEGALTLTVTDGAFAATLPATLGAAPAAPDQAGLWAMILIALLGGLILNVMPCVLPVLSIKLTSALSNVGRSRAHIRAGFLASALGVVVFFWILTGIVLMLQATGASFGWGVQFQSPLFLSIMLGIVVLFAANLLGVFEISLPQSWTTRMAQSEARGGLTGDFLTGAFAAVMATPCSAPFLGTAVTYALSNGPLEVAAIFTALGLGLAAPYLLIAARPGWIARLPKPGRWMAWVKGIMGLALVATAIWLATVLAAIAGLWVAALVIGAFVVVALTLSWGRGRGAIPVALAAALAAPFVFTPAASPVDSGDWVVFDEAQIAQRVAAGETVFVDVTADWCITCQANKRLVLDRGAVAVALSQITLMRADWTRPDSTIQSYLQSNGRFGIPFNIVYGPGAPQGIALPELLNADAVLAALAQAKGA